MERDELIIAARENEIEKVKELLSKGFDINNVDHNGDTILMIAINNSYTVLINEILKHGSDVNIKNNDGETSLMIALRYNKFSIIQEILKYCVDLNIKNNDGNTALMIALKNNELDIRSSQEIIKYSTDVNIKNNNGDTPLMIALKRYVIDYSIVLELLKKGAYKNIKEKNNVGISPFTLVIDNINNYDRESKRILELFRNYLVEEVPSIEYLKNNIKWQIDTEQNVTFLNIINSNKPIFYHFLDGFLNNSGYTANLLIEFITNNKIINNFILLNTKIINNFKLLNTKINNPINILLIFGTEMIFKDIVNNKTYLITFDRDNIFISDSINNHMINKRIINESEIANLFNYCIYILGQDNHQTTIVFFIKNKKFYILSFNSGLGINRHDHINSIKFIPYYGTFIEYTDHTKIFTIIKKFINFNMLYLKLLNINKNRYEDYINYTDIKFILEFIIHDIETKELELKLIEINMINQDHRISLNNLFDLYNYIGDEPTRINGIRKYLKFHSLTNNSIPFYDMLIGFFNLISKNKIDIHEFELLKFNIPLNIFKEENINISNIILNKNILHYHEEQLYIYPQKNGSCTWFSMYWSLVYYFILIINDPELYIKFIKYINKFFYLTLDPIFSSENFNKEYNHDVSKFIFMKNVCNKLIDLNILDNNYLIKERDFIFNKFKPISNIIVNNNSFEIYIKEVETLIKRLFITSMTETDIINNFFDLFNSEGGDLYDFKKNEHIDKNNMMIYFLYKFNNKIEIFLNLTDINILDEFDKILNQLNIKSYKEIHFLNEMESFKLDMPNDLISKLNIDYNFKLDIEKIETREQLFELINDQIISNLNISKKDSIIDKLNNKIAYLIKSGKILTEEYIKIKNDRDKYFFLEKCLKNNPTDEDLKKIHDISDKLSKLYSKHNITDIRRKLLNRQGIKQLFNKQELDILNKYSEFFKSDKKTFYELIDLTFQIKNIYLNLENIDEFIKCTYDMDLIFLKELIDMFNTPLLNDIHNIIEYFHIRTDPNKIQQNIKKIISKKTINYEIFNINKINNYYNQLKDLYNYENSLKSNPNMKDIVPSYFNNYYPWVLYLESIPLIKYLNNDNNIYLFIIFAHKINLTFQIINHLNIFINKVFIHEEDPIYGETNHTPLKDGSKYSKLNNTIKIGNLIYKNIILKLFNHKFKECQIYYDNYRGKFDRTRYKQVDYTNNQAILKEENICNSIYNINYINQFINRQKLLYLENNLNLNFRSLDDYRTLINFLLNSPNYINQSFNDKHNIENDTLFILFNYHLIEQNPKVYEKMIFYYISLYNSTQNDKILVNLGLLLLKEDISSSIKFGYNINNSSYNISTFRTKFNLLKQNNDYINSLVKDKLIKSNSLEIILNQNKYIKDAKLIGINNVEFKGIEYTSYYKVKSHLLDLFNLENKLYLLQNIDPSTEYRTYIIIINAEIIIELIGKFDDNESKIDEIYINNNRVLKSDVYLKLPFSNLIPSNCLNLIYLENEVYKIIYFSNYKYNNCDPFDVSCRMIHLLNDCNTKNGTYIIEINNNNLLLPILKTDYNLFTSLCTDYGINNLNILYLNEEIIETGIGAYNLNDNLFNIINFNKKIFLNESLESSNLMNKLSLLELNKKNTLLQFGKDDKNRIIGKLLVGNDEYNFSIGKLLFKINKCIINDLNLEKYINNFNSILETIECNINEFNTKSKIYELFNSENYDIFYNYLQNVRLYNSLKVINKLLNDYHKLKILSTDIKNLELNICNQIKIFNDIFNYKYYKFKYKFEAFFEFINGIELQNEQMIRYTDIINSFINYENITNQTSYDKYILTFKEYKTNQSIINYEIMTGGNINYPLHHIMMSKGKSAILSPLLALHLVLIYKKKVYVIVPEHLETSTIRKFNDYMHFFNCIDKIKVYSDSKIKNLYLNGEFKDYTKNKNIIMIIDEFDSLIDPIKSNYNITSHKIPFQKELCELIKIIVIYLKTSEFLNINKIIDILPQKYCNYFEIIELDINNILRQINEGILIENITWGIHPYNYYAIPYNNKDKPLLSSNFTSSIMTLFLTYYYYIIIQHYSINDYIIEIIIKNNLLLEFKFDYTIDKQEIKDLFNDKSIELKNKLFDRIFEIIFKKELLSINQSNVSFIDIINIKNIFKIGYSGTVNINLKPIDYLDNKFNIIIPDYDEQLNVENAILNAKVKYLTITKKTNQIDYLKELFDFDDIKKYKALIDLYGLFKNIKNQVIAVELNQLFNSTVIYLDEKDKEYIINKDGNTEEYQENLFYDNPFLFFDQGHTIGVDIKQDKYPIIKGLLIVDNKINYTQIAQAIFRLRKINLGHTIDICYIKNKPDDCKDIDELYSLFLQNDKVKKDMTNDLLIYQTLKYEIRKNKSDEDTMRKHNEKIKYYYNLDTEIPDKTKLDDFFTDIFTKDEIIYLKNDVNMSCLFNEIYNYDKLLKLIYNIDSYSIDHTQQSELDEQKEQTAQVTVLKEIKLESSSFRRIMLKDTIVYPPYDFIMYNYIFTQTHEYKIFNLLSIKVDELIYCLPNIFIQIDGFNYNKNTSGFLFVYIIDKILIIPGYLITHFMYNYPIFTIDLILVNINFCKLHYDYYGIIEKIKLNRIFANIKNILRFNQYDNILLYFIMINIQNDIEININITDQEIIILNKEIKEIYNCWFEENEIRKLLFINDSFKDIISINEKIKLFEGIGTDLSFQKYLKYKLKYYKSISKLYKD